MAVLCFLVVMLLALGVICLASIAVSLIDIRKIMGGDEDEWEPGEPDPDGGERLPTEDERTWPRAA